MIFINIYYFVNNFLHSRHWCKVSTTLTLTKFSAVHSWFSLFTSLVQSSKLTNLRSLYLRLVSICLQNFVFFSNFIILRAFPVPTLFLTHQQPSTPTQQYWIPPFTVLRALRIITKPIYGYTKKKYIHLLILKLEIVFFN